MHSRVKHQKKKIWQKGESCASNPISKKFRGEVEKSVMDSRNYTVISNRIEHFFSRIFVAYNQDEHEHQTKEFRENLYKIVCLLDKDSLQQTSEEFLNYCIKSIVFLLESSNTDELVFNCLCYLLINIISNNSRSLASIFPMLYQKSTILIKRNMKRPSYLIHVVKVCETIIKFSPFIDSEVREKYSKSYLNLIIHNNDNVRCAMAFSLRTINFSEIIPIHQMVLVLKKLLKRSTQISEINSLFIAIFSFSYNDLENQQLLNIMNEELMISDQCRQESLIKSYAVNQHRLYKFKNNFNIIYDQFVSLNIEQYTDECIIDVIKLLDALNCIQPMEKQNQHLKYLAILSKANIHPSPNVSNTSLSALKRFGEQIIVPIPIYLQQSLITMISDHTNIFLAKFDGSFLITILGILKRDNTYRNVEFFMNIATSLIESRNTKIDINCTKSINQLMIEIMHHIPIDNMIQLCLNWNNPQHFNMQDLGVMKLLSNFYIYMNETQFMQIFSIALFHYKMSLNSLPNEHPSSHYLTIYREIFNTLSMFFKVKRDITFNFNSILEDILIIFNNDTNVRTSIINLLADGIDCIYIDSINTLKWFRPILSFYKYNKRNNNLFTNITKCFYTLLSNCKHEIIEKFVGDIQLEMQSNIIKNNKQTIDIILICLPFTSNTYIIEYFNNLFAINKTDNKAIKQSISQLARFFSLSSYQPETHSNNVFLQKEVMENLFKYVNHYMINYHFIYSHSLVKCIYSLIQLKYLTYQRIIRFVIFTFYESNSKVMVISTKILKYFIESNPISIEQFPFEYLKEINLMHGTLHYLNIYLQHFNKLHQSIYKEIFQRIWPYKNAYERRLAKLYICILYRIKEQLYMDDYPQIIQFIIQSYKFFSDKSIQDKAYSLIRLILNKCSIKEIIEYLPSQVKRIRNIIKSMNKSQIKSYDDNNNDSEYDFVEDEMQQSKMNNVQGIVPISKSSHDDHFSEDEYGRMIIQEPTNIPNSNICQVENKQEVKIMQKDKNKKQKLKKNSHSKIQPFSYLPLSKKALKHNNGKQLGLFKGVCKTKKR